MVLNKVVVAVVMVATSLKGCLEVVWVVAIEALKKVNPSNMALK